jgi:hypothetical protein
MWPFGLSRTNRLIGVQEQSRPRGNGTARAMPRGVLQITRAAGQWAHVPRAFERRAPSPQAVGDFRHF